MATTSGDWTISGGCSAPRWPLSMFLSGAVISLPLLLEWICSVKRCGSVLEVHQQPSPTVRMRLRQCTFARLQWWWRPKVMVAVKRGGSESFMLGLGFGLNVSHGGGDARKGYGYNTRSNNEVSTNGRFGPYMICLFKTSFNYIIFSPSPLIN